MARDGKRFELKAVDEEVKILPPVVRLESEETLSREKPLRMVPKEEVKVSQRLDIPVRDDAKTRTHEPGIETLIEPLASDPHAMEQEWGARAAEHKHIPWGWFALIGLILAGAVIWSLTRVQEADGKAEQIRIETQAVLSDDLQQDEEAGQLVDRIEATIRRFFEARTIDQLLACSRQPGRVRSLMEDHYAGQPVAGPGLQDIKMLQPITLNQRANFWMTSVALDSGRIRNLILEVMPDGEVLVDWETYVCYQPMKWDDFARSRPAGTSLDFRAYLERDDFYSHEFADSKRWHSYRLTAMDSEETLFGYVPVGSEIANNLQALIDSNQGRRISVILRLGLPEGLKSRSGVVIEKLVCPRWMFVEPPDGGS